MTKQFDYTKLSIPERIRLVQEIWDSIVAEGEPPPLTPPQKEELDRRIKGHRAAPEEGASWDEVKRRIQDRLKT